MIQISYVRFGPRSEIKKGKILLFLIIISSHSQVYSSENKSTEKKGYYQALAHSRIIPLVSRQMRCQDQGKSAQLWLQTVL